MINQFFVNPTNKTIKTNILISLIKEQSLDEISDIILKLKDTNFDLSKQTIIFDEKKYGIIITK